MVDVAAVYKAQLPYTLCDVYTCY